MFGFLQKLFTLKRTANLRIGLAGERAAQRFLKREKSMKIVAKNFRAGRDEIDIVAMDGQCLVFVEVKTRAADALVDGYFAAKSKSKTAALRRCAKAYIAKMRSKPNTWRFDIVDVRHDARGKIVSVSHFENT